MNNICYIADTKKSKVIYFSLRSGSEHKREEINVSPFIMASRSGGTWGQRTSASFSTHPRFISLLIQFITLDRVAWQHPEVSTHSSLPPLQSAPSLFGWQITSFTWLTVNLKNVMCPQKVSKFMQSTISKSNMIILILLHGYFQTSGQIIMFILEALAFIQGPSVMLTTEW